MIPIALTIAGSDPSGGAGIQADLKTFHQLRVFGASAVTLITVQNTVRVSRVEPLDAGLVTGQIEAVLEDLPPNAAKTGALGTTAIIEAVAGISFDCPLIVDPVLISTQGAALLDPSALVALRDRLFPKATLVTPNLHEAAALTGHPVETPDQMKEAAHRIADLGVPYVLIKGGHLHDDPIDILLFKGAFTEFPSPRIASRHTHGTGCTYSAAITAFIARGLDVPDAIAHAKRFIHEAIATAPRLGKGAGPLNYWADPHNSV
ncbi:MAG TPA: bifunctional hydroxymethylpyrimidine kinase/phosphomethylpyrimidine kinase [Bryobacteraceae bacterium]|nr:bifunctional hydroxymethylpyrimidine kinase/phosphomethylpyrimidine kinase [Bryobacteraceae bacterium]